MAVTNYHTVNGRVIGETTGGVRTDYMRDALGSVTGTTVAGVVQNTYRYQPYLFPGINISWPSGGTGSGKCPNGLPLYPNPPYFDRPVPPPSFWNNANRSNLLNRTLSASWYCCGDSSDNETCSGAPSK